MDVSTDASKPVMCDPREIVRLVRAGDMRALERVTRCYGERLLAVGRRYCGDNERARDAVQDALVSAGEHLTDFRGDGSVEGWLIRMVANACGRMRRGRKNNPALHKVHEDDTSAPSGGASPEQAAMQAQLSASLGQAMLALQPRDRALLLLSDAEGWKAPEIAEQLHMTPAAVRTRLSRTRRRLRAELDTLWADHMQP